MSKPWDNGMKRLLHIRPQDVLDWLEQGAYFTGNRSQELQSLTLEADLMLEVIIKGILMLYHIEFQTRSDPKMPKRMMEYGMLASRIYEDCPVRSVVIYLKKHRHIIRSPLVRTCPDGPWIIFHYRVILLWEIPTETLLGLDLAGLLPLVPLTQDGAQYEVIDKIIVRLMRLNGEERTELLALAYLFAGFAFKKKADKNWLKRRFAMLGDVLRESPAFEWIKDEGREEGIKKGRQEGLQSLRQIALNITQARFPTLIELASQQVILIENPKVLEDLIPKLAVAQSAEEAQQHLLSWKQAAPKPARRRTRAPH